MMCGNQKGPQLGTWSFRTLGTEELYKKDLHNPDNQDGVITDLEPDILECEVKSMGVRKHDYDYKQS